MTDINTPLVTDLTQGEPVLDVRNITTIQSVNRHDRARFWRHINKFGSPVPTDFQWNASDLNSMQLTGTSVDEWSGLTASGTARPTMDGVLKLNGLDVVQFDGVNDCIEAATSAINTTTMTYFAVMRLGGVESSASPSVFCLPYASYGPWQHAYGINLLQVDTATGLCTPARATGDPVPPGYTTWTKRNTTDLRNGFHIVEIRIPVYTLNYEVKVDGVREMYGVQDVDDSIMPTIIRMGASGAADSGSPDAFPAFDMAESLLYDRLLTDAESESVFNYLKIKWLPLSPYVYIP